MRVLLLFQGEKEKGMICFLTCRFGTLSIPHSILVQNIIENSTYDSSSTAQIKLTYIHHTLKLCENFVSYH